MNKQRRKEIQDIVDRLDVIMTDMESVRDDEQDYMDGFPENLQGSVKYEKAEENVDNLGCACDSLEEVISFLEAAME
jgi:hypothetical protein